MPDAELLPGYWVEEDTGAWMTLPGIGDADPLSPAYGIGAQVIEWCETNLVHHLTGQPWEFTPGQYRFLLRWYALSPDSTPNRPRWLYRSGVKRGAKGTGKDPFLGAVANAELCGPVVPVWDGDGWHGVAHRMALVQIGANSEAQAQDVLRVANAMVPAATSDEHGFDKGINRTQLVGTGSRIEVLTNSERSAEGDPATAILLNESHHMTHSSGGQALAAVARRNTGKSPGGMARVLEGTNAHMPGEGSVAEDSYEAWQAQVSGRTRKRDILYDSREAPPHLSLTVPEDVMAGLEAAYHDAPWTDRERIFDDIQDLRTTTQDSVRFYFSSTPTAEDAWVDPRKFDACKRDALIEDGDAIALFLDCSKSGDATALCACRISDGHSFALGAWQRPHGDRGKGWLAPRSEVDGVVRAAFERFDVQWFGVDPSPARDDEDESLYWGPLVDQWHRDFRESVLLWATPGATKGSAVSWDMRQSHVGGKDRIRLFTEECEVTADMVDEHDPSAGEPAFTWGGGGLDAMLALHCHQARRRPNAWGVSIGKQSRTSSKLVDLAVALVGARVGRRLILNSGKDREVRKPARAMFL